VETEQGWKIVWDPFSHPNSDPTKRKGSREPSGGAAAHPSPEDGGEHGIGHMLHSLARAFSHATPRPSTDGGHWAQLKEQQQHAREQQQGPQNEQQQGVASVQVPQLLSAAAPLGQQLAAHRRSTGGHEPTIQEECSYRDGMPPMELDTAGSNLLSPFATLAQVVARLPACPGVWVCAPLPRQLVWRIAALRVCLQHSLCADV
jgi:hypothetical protein